MAITTVIMSGFMASCSSDSDDNMSATRFEDLKFTVEVTTGTPLLKAASDNKSGWAKGDKIIFMADNQTESICQMEYDGEDWQVSKISENPVFDVSGKIKAVFSDNLTYTSESNIRTKGDILYTESGTYVNEDDVVRISLKMSQRPVCKIRVNGVGNDFFIDGLKEFSTLDLTTMSWSDNQMHGLENRESEGSDSYTFYGTFDENVMSGATTTIKFVNEDGDAFVRTYDMSMESGNYVIINGPLSEEQEQWKKDRVKFLISEMTFEEPVINTEVGNDITLKLNILPSNATDKTVSYSSSNTSIVTIDDNGTAHAVGIGEAEITAVSCDGSEVKAMCKIVVGPKPVSGILLDGAFGVIQLMLTPGDTYKFTAQVFPANATNKTLAWTSSDESVVEVNSSGEITAKSTGSATITVSATDGSKVSSSCKVTVVDEITDHISAKGSAGIVMEYPGGQWYKDNISITPLRLPYKITINSIDLYVNGQKVDSKTFNETIDKETSFEIKFRLLYSGEYRTKVQYTYKNEKFTKDVQTTVVTR